MVLVQWVLIIYFIELVISLWDGSEQSIFLWFIVILLFIVMVLNFLVMLLVVLICLVISLLRLCRCMCLGINWVKELMMVIIGLLKLVLVILVVCYNVWVFVILWLCVVVVEWYLGMFFLFLFVFIKWDGVCCFIFNYLFIGFNQFYLFFVLLVKRLKKVF